ncbi:VOC family protein [Vibrio sp. TH_r3]|uniref:VOC family protein n=1 Tax=Vibrio sp. TH_r3 TaxID=3082084 RepID=UPI0029553A5A|nr:VOC family protein [Vibrio sp. TH_r3]MDV7103125.1 VOC family protein [Vibrio sp. TH_r3]
MDNSLTELGLTPEQMLAEVAPFVDKIHVLAGEIGLDLVDLQADHIALRINQHSLAEQAHQAWLDYGEVISSAQINGRPIIVYQLTSPIVIGCWQIECLELPYPAAGKVYPQQGWEHIEFVIPSNATTAEDFLQELMNKFPLMNKRWHALEQQGVKTKLSSPKGEGERLANPTVAFKKSGVCIKLHPHSLKNVVLSESE